jgi:hypothetical protein
MARPKRNNVDYFPFICEDGNKMFYIEETYGNDGFATFVKLLRELAKTNYHYLDLSKPSTMMFLSAKCKVSKDILEQIIKDLVELGKFDKALWNENKIVWCQDFVDSIQDAYTKRNNKCITYEGLLLLLISLGVRKQGKLPLKGGSNTQSIVKDSIEDESKVDIIDNFNFKKSLIDLGVNEKLVNEWMQVRKKKKAVNTETALKGFISEQQKTNKGLDEIIEMCVQKSWAGFDASWIQNKTQGTPVERKTEGMMNIVTTTKSSTPWLNNQ